MAALEHRLRENVQPCRHRETPGGRYEPWLQWNQVAAHGNQQQHRSVPSTMLGRSSSASWRISGSSDPRTLITDVELIVVLIALFASQTPKVATAAADPFPAAFFISGPRPSDIQTLSQIAPTAVGLAVVHLARGRLESKRYFHWGGHLAVTLEQFVRDPIRAGLFTAEELAAFQ